MATALVHHPYPWGSGIASNRHSVTAAPRDMLYQSGGKRLAVTLGPQFLSKSIVVVSPRLRSSPSKGKIGSPNNVEDVLEPGYVKELFLGSMSPQTGKAFVSSTPDLSPSSIRAGQRPVTSQKLVRSSTCGALSRSSTGEEVMRLRLAEKASQKEKEDAMETLRARWYAINYLKRMQENALCAKFIDMSNGNRYK